MLKDGEVTTINGVKVKFVRMSGSTFFPGAPLEEQPACSACDLEINGPECQNAPCKGGYFRELPIS